MRVYNQLQLESLEFFSVFEREMAEPKPKKMQRATLWSEVVEEGMLQLVVLFGTSL